MTRTLVVDDDPAVLEMLASLLRGHGHDVTTSGDGREAYDLLLADDFDLCVLDHQLPRMTGLDVAGAFSATGRDTLFILVSGLARLGRERHEEVDQFVRKPFDSDEFLKVVDALLMT